MIDKLREAIEVILYDQLGPDEDDERIEMIVEQLMELIRERTMSRCVVCPICTAKRPSQEL